VYVAPSLPEETASFHPVLASEAANAVDYARNSPLFALSNHLMYLDWYWGEVTTGRLEEIIRRGHAFWWLKEGGDVAGLLCMAIDEDDDEELRPYIQLLACAQGDLHSLLLDYRRLAGRMGYDRAGWMAPEKEAILPVLYSAGYQSDWENSLYLFEKKA
jgi:hypothetical protein